MYYRPFDEAKKMQSVSGNKHLEGVHFKGQRWYARARAGRRHVLEMSFKEEEHAYYCWVGITKCREEMEMEKSETKLNVAERVKMINMLGGPHGHPEEDIFEEQLE